MIDLVFANFVVFIANVVLSLAAKFLPTSPFQSMAVPDGLITYLGWLNWLVDFNGIGMVFTAWLSAGILWACFCVSRDVLCKISGVDE